MIYNEIAYTLAKSTLLINLINNEPLDKESLSVILEYLNTHDFFKETPEYIPYPIIEMVKQQATYKASVFNETELNTFINKYIEEINNNFYIIKNKEFIIDYIYMYACIPNNKFLSIDEVIKKLLTLKNINNNDLYFFELNILTLKVLASRVNEYKNETIEIMSYIKESSSKYTDIYKYINI